MSSGSAFFTRDDGTVVVFQAVDDCLDYGLDHAALLADGDAIVSSAWEAEGQIAVAGSGVVGAVATVMVMGAGGRLRNTIETQRGRRRVSTFCVEVSVSC